MFLEVEEGGKGVPLSLSNLFHIFSQFLMSLMSNFLIRLQSGEKTHGYLNKLFRLCCRIYSILGRYSSKGASKSLTAFFTVLTVNSVNSDFCNFYGSIPGSIVTSAKLIRTLFKPYRY